MQKFYIKIKPLPDTNIIGQTNAHIYGTFKAYKNLITGQYQACNFLGVTIYINIKTRKAFLMNDGDFMCYGKITEFSRDDFDIDYNTFRYKKRHLEIINKLIKNLKSDKQKIIQELREKRYGKS